MSNLVYLKCKSELLYFFFIFIRYCDFKKNKFVNLKNSIYKKYNDS